MLHLTPFATFSVVFNTDKLPSPVLVGESALMCCIIVGLEKDIDLAIRYYHESAAGGNEFSSLEEQRLVKKKLGILQLFQYLCCPIVFYFCFTVDEETAASVLICKHAVEIYYVN